MDNARVLSNLADRLWYTLATEVPSERAFSALQIAKSKTRNRLTDNRVDKLLFVQMNLRALDVVNRPRFGCYSLGLYGSARLYQLN